MEFVKHGRLIKYLASLLSTGVAIYAVLRWLKTENHSRDVSRRTKKKCVRIVDTPTQWEEIYPVLMKQCDDTIRVVGLDCEWISWGRRRPVALVQIATQDGLCILVRVFKMSNQIPLSFKEFMRDRSILKVGVSVFDDGLKLSRDYGVTVHGCLDLRHLLERVSGIYDCSEMGLQGLSQAILEVTLNKSPHIRCGDWEVDDLSEEQVEYAALDALVAVDIFSDLVFAGALRRKPTSEEQLSYEKFNKTAMFLSENAIGIPYRRRRDNQTSSKSLDNLLEPSRKSLGSKDTSRAFSTRQEPLDFKCHLLAPDGEILCACSRKKVNWYIEKGLGELVSEDPLTARLLFEPRKRSETKMKYYVPDDGVNVCVVCGDNQSYTYKDILPLQYRKFFPKDMKTCPVYNKVLVCSPCHYISSQHEAVLKQRLADLCDAPLNHGAEGRTITDQELQKVRSAAKALKINSNKIPESRRKDLQNTLCSFYDVDSVSDELLTKAMDIEIHVANEAFVSHEKKVADYIKEHYDFKEFIGIWRQHFIQTMNPKFLYA